MLAQGPAAPMQAGDGPLAPGWAVNSQPRAPTSPTPVTERPRWPDTPTPPPPPRSRLLPQWVGPGSSRCGLQEAKPRHEWAHSVQPGPRQTHCSPACPQPTPPSRHAHTDHPSSSITATPNLNFQQRTRAGHQGMGPGAGGHTHTTAPSPQRASGEGKRPPRRTPCGEARSPPAGLCKPRS